MSDDWLKFSNHKFNDLCVLWTMKSLAVEEIEEFNYEWFNSNLLSNYFEKPLILE